MENLLREKFAQWAQRVKAGDAAGARDLLFNGNKWAEERWKTTEGALQKAIESGVLRVAGETIAGPVGQVYVLLKGESKPERVCFMLHEKQWRMLASIGDFTATPWDYNTERSHAITDPNCDYMKWAARKSGWASGELMGLDALLKYASDKAKK